MHGRFYHVYCRPASCWSNHSVREGASDFDGVVSRHRRDAGIPARLVGTPAWLGDPTIGNHNWVEIWDGAAWRFWEGRPAGGGETLANPCDKWFCKAARFPLNGSTKVYAARFDRHANKTTYPLAWDPTNLDTPGVDRTDAYVGMCSNC